MNIEPTDLGCGDGRRGRDAAGAGAGGRGRPGDHPAAPAGRAVQLPHLQAVSERLVAYQEIRYVGVATGRYDIIVEAFFNDHEHLLQFVSSKLGALKGVTGAETSLILKVAKFSYEWEIP